MLANGILCYLRMCQELLSTLVALIKIESSIEDGMVLLTQQEGGVLFSEK